MERINLAIRQALESNPAGETPKSIAAKAGMSASYLYSLAEAGEAVPMARMIQLYSITGDSRPVDALCRVCGGVYVPEPQADAQRCDTALLKAIKENSDFVQAVAQAMLDNRVSITELVLIERAAMDLQQAVVRVVSSARASCKEARKVAEGICGK